MPVREQVKFPALGRELTRLQKAAFDSQADFAAAIEPPISTSYANKILNGQRHPGLFLLLRMAEALEVDIDPLARIAGFPVPDLGKDHPSLPGWELLRESDKLHIRRQVRDLAALLAPPAANPEEGSPQRPATLRVSNGAAPRTRRARSNRAGQEAG